MNHKFDYLKDGSWKACQNGTYRNFTRPEKTGLVLTCLEKLIIGLITIIGLIALIGVI